MSWATAAKAQPPQKPAEALELAVNTKRNVAVVDASVLIGGTIPRNLTENLVTTPDVQAEIRDKQTRQALGTLPFGCAVQQPLEESVAAVTKFARATGDIHSLSTADIRLIALAHTLHADLHGVASLRVEPPPPRAVGRSRERARQLPGWGARGGTWAELDKLGEAKLRAREAAQGASVSRIAAQVHALSLADTLAPTQKSDEDRPSLEPQTPSKPEPARAARRPSATQGPQAATAPERSSAHDENGDAGDWVVAASSRNAFRRKQRKDARRATRAAHSVPEGRTQQAADAPAPRPNRDSDWPLQPEPRSTDTRLVSSGEKDASNGDEEPDAAESQPGTPSESSAAAESDAVSESGAESESSAASTAGGDGAQSLPDLSGVAGAAGHAGVSILTADFAMQNVILQMGLRLVSPDGRKITRVGRWVLRCSACFKVTKEMERLFCPSCGNAALEKVELVVREDGTEQYGIRKRHIIRGTKYPLPRPKGGKKSRDPILREDVLLQRLPKKKPRETGTDPFVPEYTDATWHGALRGGGPAAPHRGVAALLAPWKRNPNERRHMRSNRRK